MLSRRKAIPVDARRIRLTWRTGPADLKTVLANMLIIALVEGSRVRGRREMKCKGDCLRQTNY